MHGHPRFSRKSHFWDLASTPHNPYYVMCFGDLLHGSIVASFSKRAVTIGSRWKQIKHDLTPKGDALEELIGAQALNTELKPALMACLTGQESRRWTIGEFSERLNNLGLRCSKPAVAAALGELELEMTLCPFLPWSLAEAGTEWSLSPKSELLELLSGVRKLPGISRSSTSDATRPRRSYWS